eukprot:gene241-443_t
MIEFPIFKIWKKSCVLLDHEEQQDSGFGFQDYVDSLTSLLQLSSPLSRKGKIEEERKELEAGRAGKDFPNVKLTVDQVHAVLGLSDDMKISEFDCLKYWIHVSKPDVRRWLELQLDMPGGSLDHQLQLACKELIFLEADCLLDTVIMLMKARIDDKMIVEKRRHIISLTNAILRNGIMLKLMESAGRGIQELQQSQNISSNRISLLERSIKKVSECVFFAYYQTQIEEGEEAMLVELIACMSGILTAGDLAMVADMATGRAHPSSPPSAEWRSRLCPSLVILQLAQVCGLAQTHDLLDRRIDEAPFTQPGTLNLLTLTATGASTVSTSSSSSLPDIISRQLHLDKTWPSEPAKGFSALVYAVLLQPAVDVGRLPPTCVTSVLTQAAEMRAYSYVRLVMLPLLRLCRDEENLPFYMSALCELTGNLLTVFCLEVYDRFPFPSSRHQQEEDVKWSNTQLVPLAAHTALPSCDSLEDLVELLDALCVMHPRFAEQFLWHGSASHPFLARAIDLVKDPALSMRLLTAAASGPDGSTAYNAYLFMEKRLAGKRDWSFLFSYMEDIALQLGGQAADERTVTYGTTGTVSADTAPSRARKLSPNDAEALLTVVKLLTVSIRQPMVLQSLHASFRAPDSVASRLFGLLACPVPSTVKGALFRALATIVSASKDTSVEIWRLLEEFRLLPMTRAAPGSKGTQTFGLRYELDVVEAASGCYVATDGFLQLLDALITCEGNELESLGTGYRRPGIQGYVEYVVQEVLMKVYSRQYYPSGTLGEGQKWRLASRSIRILISVLKSYRINELAVNSVGDGRLVVTGPEVGVDGSATSTTSMQSMEADFREEMVRYAIRRDGMSEMQFWPRPKTVGFAVMSWILGKTRLFDCILQLLRDCAAVQLNHVVSDQIREVHQRAVYGLSSRASSSNSLSLSLQPYADSIDPGMDAGGCQCDEAYWRESCLGLCLGLFHECARREERFVQRVWAAERTLTLHGADENKPNSLAVRVQRLPVLLGAHAADCPLALVAQVTNFRGLDSLCWPAIPVLALRLLQYVSEEGTGAELDTLSPSNEVVLTTAVVRALCSDDDHVVGSDNSHPSVVIRLGADVSSSTVPFALDDFSDRDHAVAIKESDDYSTRTNRSDASAREAALDLLLAAQPHSESTHTAMGMRLLGLQGVVEASRMGPVDPAESSEWLPSPKPGIPTNGLEALLELLDPRENEVNNTSIRPLMVSSPLMAAKGYELLYVLCAAPQTSSPVLGVLRRRNIAFLNRQIPLSLELDPSHYDDQNKEAAIRGLYTCRAWLLQICALELHALQQSSGNVRTIALSLLNMLLFRESVSQDLQPSSLRMDSEIPLMQALFSINANDTPELQIQSPHIAQIMQRCCENVRSAEIGFAIVDLFVFGKMLQSEVVLSGGAISKEELELHLQSASSFNRYSMRCRGAAHLCAAWSQLTCIVLLECIPLLLLEDRGQTLRILRIVIDDILLPCLDRINGCADMWFAEPLARVSAAAVSCLRTIGAPMSTVQTEAVVSGLCRALLRRGASSSLYRGLVTGDLMHSIRQLLTCSGENHVQQGDTVSSLHISDRVVTGGESRERGLIIFAGAAPALVVVLGRDATTGPLLWRLTAISALTLLLSSLSVPAMDSSSRHMDGFSSAINASIQSLVRGGHLQSLMDTISFSNDVKMGLTGSMDTSADGATESDDLHNAVLTFFATVARTRDGVQLLVDHGILKKLTNIPLRIFPSAVLLDTRQSLETRDTSQRVMLARLGPVIRLLCVLAKGESSRAAVLDACATSLNTLRTPLELVLRFHLSSLSGMQLLEDVLSLMNIVASSPWAVHAERSDTSRPTTGILWDIRVDQMIGEAYNKDVYWLLAHIGANLVPSQWSGMRSAGKKTTFEWWGVVQPSTERERGLQSEPQSPPVCVSSVLTSINNWSAFDSLKLNHALQITLLAASFIRLRAASRLNVRADEEWASLEELRIAGDVLHFCGDLALCYASGEVANQAVAENWLRSPTAIVSLISDNTTGELSGEDQVLQAKLIWICENIMCALHDLCLCVNPDTRGGVIPIIDKCQAIAEGFSPHSFLQMSMRWIVKQVMQELRCVLRYDNVVRIMVGDKKQNIVSKMKLKEIELCQQFYEVFTSVFVESHSENNINRIHCCFALKIARLQPMLLKCVCIDSTTAYIFKNGGRDRFDESHYEPPHCQRTYNKDPVPFS